MPKTLRGVVRDKQVDNDDKKTRGTNWDKLCNGIEMTKDFRDEKTGRQKYWIFGSKSRIEWLVIIEAAKKLQKGRPSLTIRTTTVFKSCNS